MAKGIAINLNSINPARVSKINKISIQLFFSEKFLNFKENRGNSIFITVLSNKVAIIKKYELWIRSEKKEISEYIKINGNEITNIAIAGVGKPINEVDWRSSKLKLANLYAAATGNKKPINGINWISDKLQVDISPFSTKLVAKEFSLIAFSINWYITKPGATPEVTISARESNCFPNSLFTFNIRAANPSKKSKKIPINTNKAAICKLFKEAAKTATTPQNRFSSVIKFGICFLIIVGFSLGKFKEIN